MITVSLSLIIDNVDFAGADIPTERHDVLRIVQGLQIHRELWHLAFVLAHQHGNDTTARHVEAPTRDQWQRELHRLHRCGHNRSPVSGRDARD